MSYQIVYYPEQTRNQSQRSGIGIRMMVTAGMLATLIGVVRYWPAGKELLTCWLTVPEWSATERALQAVAEQIEMGEGWYHGLVAGCRSLLESFV